jgi:hypothetical protein
MDPEENTWEFFSVTVAYEIYLMLCESLCDNDNAS